jgi:flagellar assembly protein FliH
MKSFHLQNFNEESKESSSKSEFVTYFDETERPESGQPTPIHTATVEEQSRKVFEDAFVQGEKAGYEMGMKKVDPLVKRLNTYIGELGFFKEELLRRSQKLSTDLAIAFAEAIVLKECSERPETVLAMVKKAMELCEEKNEITIRMRKEDVEMISPDQMSHLKIVKDDTMKEPGFIIETNFGDIDGRVSIQIEELKKELLNGSGD